MAKQTEKLKKRFGFSRKRMSIIKNIVLRGDCMSIKEFNIFMIIFIVCCSIVALFASIGDTPSDYVKANRYSRCIEKLSDNEVLSFDEMKEVCIQYLK